MYAFSLNNESENYAFITFLEKATDQDKEKVKTLPLAM